MKEKKLCFITCVSDETLYNEALYYIHKLVVPDGYQLECITVWKPSSMAAGYNQAMAASDATYKIYLRQNVFLLNKHFLLDLLRLFDAHTDVGMIAAAGGARLLPDGIWHHACERYGTVWENSGGTMRKHCFGASADDLQDIQAAAGFWIATQQDVPFREEHFAGSAFCEASQSIEFLRKSLRVVVPSWESPSCICMGDALQKEPAFETDQYSFLKAYSVDLFPPVSILIPTYNQVRFFKHALESALYQTYQNTEVLVSDDSTTDEVYTFIQPYLKKHPNLRYLRNKPHAPDYGLSNSQHCIDESKHDYISFLYHDDLAEPDKIETMMAYAIQNPDASLITSAFYFINENGSRVSLSRYFDQDTKIDGPAFVQRMLDRRTNMVGAPSAALIKKACIDRQGFTFYGDQTYFTNVDVAMWFSVLEHGSAIYIANPLSSFRISTEQNSAKPEILIGEQSDWLSLFMVCRKKGYTADISKYRHLLCQYINASIHFLDQSGNGISGCEKRLSVLRDRLAAASDDVFATLSAAN